jgi:hypothetical protein
MSLDELRQKSKEIKSSQANGMVTISVSFLDELLWEVLEYKLKQEISALNDRKAE